MRSVLLMAFVAAACGAEREDEPPTNRDAGEPPPEWNNPAPELGPQDGNVTLTVIASAANGLRTPRDLAFNPRRPDELWVVNRADDSVVIVTDASTDGRTHARRKDAFALHFMDETASIAFGGDETTIGLPGTFGTCGESRNTYDHTAHANDFMGPALWSSDLSVFAMKDPEGLGSHLDMLHHSPLCVGIAHETANIYWAVGGRDQAIYRYDFALDHQVGRDDHSDGSVWEYAKGQISYVPDVPSHLQYDPTDGAVYVADTGNARVIKLDTSTAVQQTRLSMTERIKYAWSWSDATVTDIVPGDSGELVHPSGLELHDGRLLVSDNATGRISAFAMNGALLHKLETGLAAGALAGMAVGPDRKLYFVDVIGNRVLRIDP